MTATCTGPLLAQGAPQARILTGMYVRDDGTRVFTPCGGRDVVRVAAQDDAVTLDAFYAQAQRTSRDRLLVEVEGRIETQATAGPAAAPATLVVTRFVAGWPGEVCPVPDVRMPLEQSYASDAARRRTASVGGQ
jgi:hypothetical protein